MDPCRRRHQRQSPPNDDADLLDYAAPSRHRSSPTSSGARKRSASPSPTAHRFPANQRRPVESPTAHRFPANQRRPVESLRRFPIGWVLLGDAVCSYDPIYGQGMASAAQQADALGKALDRARAVNRPFARAYFRAVAPILGVPWSIAVGGDFA